MAIPISMKNIQKFEMIPMKFLLLFLSLNISTFATEYEKKEIADQLFFIYKTPLNNMKEIKGHAMKHVPQLFEDAKKAKIKITGPGCYILAQLLGGRFWATVVQNAISHFGSKPLGFEYEVLRACIA